ncbi:MAG TPA: hypothetical protein ENN77_02175 [Candidatus Wirthbacteria bacterium]|nr:hypothetical protein [Candidatus Wirthbacteria bacterium]
MPTPANPSLQLPLLDLAKHLDYTQLHIGTSYELLRQITKKAVQYGCATVCVRPQHLGWTLDILAGSATKACVVIGYEYLTEQFTLQEPATQESLSRYSVPWATKLEKLEKILTLLELFEPKVELEIDYLPNLLDYLRAAPQKTYEEINHFIAYVRQRSPETLVKLIGENYFLTDEQKAQIYTWGKQAGFDFFKSCSGYTARGATIEDIILMQQIAQNQIKIKAAGRVNQYNYQGFLNLGVDRIGSSQAEEILVHHQTLLGEALCKGGS